MAHIVFIGAGHGHLPVLQHAASFRAAGHRLTLVAPEDFYYSGLVTGVLAGDYAAEADRVDIAAFAERHGFSLVRKRTTGLDLAAKSVRLADGEHLPFDLLSLAVGSEGKSLPGAAAGTVTPVKPIPGLIALKQQLAGAGAIRLAIIGGGLAGCEIALCLKSAFPSLEISLFTRHQIMGGWQAAAAKVRAALQTRQIALYENASVAGLEGGRVQLENGASPPFDHAILATGLKCPAFLGESGLLVDDMGAVKVNRHLQSVSHPDVFAIGDCMAFGPRPLDKAGVYAIRGAPVLKANLLARAAGKPLKAFTPQRRYLWIMNLGNGEALAARPPLLWQGRSAWWLKDYIDRRFVEGLKG